MKRKKTRSWDDSDVQRVVPSIFIPFYEKADLGRIMVPITHNAHPPGLSCTLNELPSGDKSYYVHSAYAV